MNKKKHSYVAEPGKWVEYYVWQEHGAWCFDVPGVTHGVAVDEKTACDAARRIIEERSDIDVAVDEIAGRM
jgi:hypothetical protein